MATDWLKVEVNTPDKIEVFIISTALGWADPDLVVGKLIKVWRWFDQHTENGNAPSVTIALLDNIVGVTGFAKEMQNVGWLVKTDDGVSLPNFDRHNGKTAKTRALGAKRAASFRGNEKSNADSNDKSNDAVVTDALPSKVKKSNNITTTPALVPNPIFDAFWNIYPPSKRKEAKGKCKDVWQRKRLDLVADKITAHLKAVMSEYTKEDARYCPAPLAYLNGEKWDGAEVIGGTMQTGLDYGAVSTLVRTR